MTVQQLIQKLNQFPQDLRVMVEGYEGGYEDLEVIRLSKVGLNIHESEIYGNHDTPEPDCKTIDALIFYRQTGF